MRTEKEMMNLILTTARNDERIRSVILNGSRANPNAKKDRFMDFDIIYLVTDVQDLLDQKGWIGRFGEMMILQLPDTMSIYEQKEPGKKPESDKYEAVGRFCFLMQFMDGNRIDLTLMTKEYYLGKHKAESLSMLLLDKDGDLPHFPEPDESDYFIRIPTKKIFHDCCNEFWWLIPYIAKSMARREYIYAKRIQDGPVRDMFYMMINWFIGIKEGFETNPGKGGKNYPFYLDEAMIKNIGESYSGITPSDIWISVFKMIEIFRLTGRAVAEYFSYDYPGKEDADVSHYVTEIQMSSERDT